MREMQTTAGRRGFACSRWVFIAWLLRAELGHGGGDFGCVGASNGHEDLTGVLAAVSLKRRKNIMNRLGINRVVRIRIMI